MNLTDYRTIAMFILNEFFVNEWSVHTDIVYGINGDCSDQNYTEITVKLININFNDYPYTWRSKCHNQDDEIKFWKQFIRDTTGASRAVFDYIWKKMTDDERDNVPDETLEHFDDEVLYYKEVPESISLCSNEELLMKSVINGYESEAQATFKDCPYNGN